MTLCIRRRLGRSVLMLSVVTLGLWMTTTAESAWLNAASAPAAARARSLSTSATPTTVFRRPRVTISWEVSGFADGGVVPAYVVRRYNAATGLGQPTSNSCSGLVTALTCSDNAPAGTWRYTVTAAAGGWRGIESPQSAPVIVA